MEDNSILKTLAQGLFIVLALVVIMFVSLGLELDFSRLKTFKYWVSVIIKLSLTMLTYNIIYRLDRKNKLNLRTSRFFVAYATNRLRISKIYTDKKLDQLQKAVDEENEKRLQNKCEKLFNKICSYVKYADIEKPVEDLIEFYKIQKKYHKKFIKIYNKVKSGRVKIKKLKISVFLTDKQLVNSKEITYDYSLVRELFLRNTAKMFSFLFFTMLSSIIIFTFVIPSIWTEIVSNVTIILGAISSGFASSSKDVKHLTFIYENRNNFIFEHLEIKEEYIPETKSVR